MKIIKAKELANKEFTARQNTINVNQEISYRRGYRHGYSEGMDDVTNKGRSKIAKFFDKVLMPWSYLKGEDLENLFVPPPRPKK
jgi:flagellar biosynthesis/type III secretory pathway protein FliH